MGQNIFELDIAKKLKILIAGRLIIATAMLGGVVLTAFPRLNFYNLIVASYLLTIFYIFALNTGRAVLFQAYFQIILDGVFLTGLIHWTGGIDSPFIFLYILPIVSAAVIISSRACITIAIVSSICYTIFVKLEFYEVIKPFNPASYEDPGFVTYLLFLQVSMMIIISFLSSYLSESLRRKGAELKELKSFTDEILNHIPNGVIAFDRFNYITYLNKSARKIFGLPPEKDVKGSSIYDLWPANDKNEKIGFENLRHQTVVEGETTFYLAGDKKMPVRYVGTRLYYENGKIKGGVIIFHDLSKERLSAIGEMAAELAHEIRNPLAALSGSLEVLKEEISVPKENEEIMELIMKEAECLNTIVTDFLYFSRPKELHLTTCPLKNIIEEALGLVRNHPHFSDRIKINFSNNINPRIKMDQVEMRQAFFNLCLNAIEAMPNGGNLSIKIAAAPEGKAGKEKLIKIYFSDEGFGVLQRDRGRLFEPFYTTKERGVGLGLAISSRIVKDHGGDISVTNNPERGATFLITLPKL